MPVADDIGKLHNRLPTLTRQQSRRMPTLKQLVLNLVAKPLLALTMGTVFGLLFVILPCYVFPLLGSTSDSWCGYKGLPPHFAIQFWTGFGLAVALSLYLSYRKSRPEPSETGLREKKTEPD
jgi:hypothetical protein